MEADIRPAVREDLPGIVEIYNEAVRETTGTYDSEPHTIEQRTAWLEQCTAKGFPVLVAAVNGTVAAWGALGPFVERAGFRHTGICAVYVETASRGMGLGTTLIEALVIEARQRELHTMLAAVDAANDASLRLHEKLGFKRVGTFREVGRKNGRWHDVVYLQRML
jgi:phosphinothricin acetyltransferase